MGVKCYPWFQQYSLSSAAISQRKAELYRAEDGCLDVGQSLPFFRFHRRRVELQPWLHKHDLQVLRDKLLADHLGRLAHKRGDLVDVISQFFVNQSVNLSGLGPPAKADQDAEQQSLDFALNVVAAHIGQLLVSQRSPPACNGLSL